MTMEAGAPAAGAAPVAGAPATPGVVVSGASASTTVPYGGAPAPTPSPVDIKTLIPAEYKDKPYLAGVDSVDKLFKAFDGAQTLLGKRPAGIPDANATPEQVEAFWKSAGKPEKAEEYVFEPVEGLKYSDEFTSAVKGLFHQAHVPKAMATQLQKGFDAIQLKMVQAAKAEQEASDKEFDTLVKPHMGADMDKALKQSQALIKSILPAELAPHLDQLTSGQAAILAVVINKFAEKYVSEDALHLGGGGAGAQGETVESLRAEARALMAKPEYNRVDHPEHENNKRAIAEIYGKINKLTKRP